MQSYSERLVIAETEGVVTNWTVPAGKRASLQSVVAANNSPAARSVYLLLRGEVVWSHVIPANEGVTLRFMLVAYAGEVVGALFLGSSEMGIAVSGFLFDDELGRDDEAMATTEGPPPPGLRDRSAG